MVEKCLECHPFKLLQILWKLWYLFYKYSIFNYLLSSHGDGISSTSYHTSFNSSIRTTFISIFLEQPSFHILNLVPARNCFKKICITFLFSSFPFSYYSLYLAWVTWSVISTTFCHYLQVSLPFDPASF